MTVLIAPYSAKLFNGAVNPKQYPYWPKLVALLNTEGYEVIQIGIKGESRIDGVDQFVTNFPYHKIRDLVDQSVVWISVDSWLQHFVHYHRLKRGIVLWGQSDPRIFGYPTNVNLLRGRDYLRTYPYDTWMAVTWNPQAFVYAENVLPEVCKLAPPPLKSSRVLSCA